MLITETTPFVKLSAFSPRKVEIKDNRRKIQKTSIILNTDKIVSIADQGQFTEVTMSNDKTFLVHENSEKILELIYGDEI